MIKKRESDWKFALYELWIRFSNACKSFKFLFNFLTGILLISGIGIWLPYLKNYNTDHSSELLLSANLVTFSMAIIGTIYINHKVKNGNESILKDAASFFAIIAIILSIYGYLSNPTTSSIWTNIGTSISLMIYILIYANDPKFDNNTASAAGYEEVDPSYLPDGKSE